jgi:hypothetical protein
VLLVEGVAERREAIIAPAAIVVTTKPMSCWPRRQPERPAG